MLEHRVILDISHLPCQFSDCKLAVTVQVVQVCLPFPKVIVFLLQQLLDEHQLGLVQHGDVALPIIIIIGIMD